MLFLTFFEKDRVEKLLTLFFTFCVLLADITSQDSISSHSGASTVLFY